MKKIFYTFLLTTPLLFISSCEEDESSDNTNNNTPTNYVLYDDNYYEMNGPCIIEDFGYWGDDAGTYNLDIIIGSSNTYLSYEYSDPIIGQYDTTVNSNLFYLELFSPEAMLNSGTYNFEETYNSMTFDYGDFGIFNGGVPENVNEILSVGITGGTVNININTLSSSITINANCTTDENKDISAHWEGDYIYYDSSDLVNSSEEFKKNKPISLMKQL